MNNMIDSFKDVKKSITSLKIIMWFRLLTGIYFKISDSKLICWLTRLFCICICVACSMAVYANFRISLNRTDIFCILEYILSITFSVITAEEYLFKFCDAISTADTIMDYKKVSLVSNYTNIIFFSILMSKLGLIILHFQASDQPIVNLICVSIVYIAIDIYYMTVIVVFSLLHTRMMMLRNFLEGISIPVNIIGQNEVANSIRNLRKGLFNYSYLLDNLDIINKQMQYLVTAAIAFNVPPIIPYMYVALKVHYQEINPLKLTVFIWYAVEAIFVATLPGVIAELVTFEVVRIKRTLTTQLYKCSDESLRYELETAVRYVRRRPFKFMICGAVPLDARLPLKMAALCLTYVIILVQLFHLR